MEIRKIAQNLITFDPLISNMENLSQTYQVILVGNPSGIVHTNTLEYSGTEN